MLWTGKSTTLVLTRKWMQMQGTSESSGYQKINRNTRLTEFHLHSKSGELTWTRNNHKTKYYSNPQKIMENVALAFYFMNIGYT
jgi:hypothetical protein